MKRRAYLIACLLLAAAMLWPAGREVLAASTTETGEKVELRADCTLDITYASGGRVFADQEIRLWHVADYRVGLQKNGSTFQITNTHASEEIPPETGDTFRGFPYAALMLVSGAMLIVLGLIGKRRSHAK